jgi:hypothetical protein
MKCILTTVLLTMSCLTASSRASAQATAQAKVPFEFTVGQSVLPPGEYSIKEVSPSMIEIYNLEKGATFYVVTFASDYVSRKPNILLFSKYGDKYFLREVRGGVGEYSLGLNPSKLEMEFQSQMAARSNKQTAEIALK